MSSEIFFFAVVSSTVQVIREGDCVVTEGVEGFEDFVTSSGISFEVICSLTVFGGIEDFISEI